jgi:integron integrase
MGMSLPTTPLPHKPKLLEAAREVLRRKHYSLRTEGAYLDWIKRFVLFHGKRHPREMGPAEIQAFLTHLAVEGNVAASTQNQALSALLFLYGQVLDIELPRLAGIAPARRPHRLPAVFTREEARGVIAHLKGDYALMARLLYGSGLRLLECLRLRVKDIDFARLQITVREAKGNKDRVTMLPVSVAPALRDRLETVRTLHRQALAQGHGGVFLPGAYERKSAGAAKAWAWQYVFPADKASVDPRSGECAVTTWAKRTCKMRSRKPSAELASPRRQVATRSDTALPRICWKAATISAPCRNCLATRMSRRP